MLTTTQSCPKPGQKNFIKVVRYWRKKRAMDPSLDIAPGGFLQDAMKKENDGYLEWKKNRDAKRRLAQLAAQSAQNAQPSA